ncbi:hypothetical protein SAMN05216279_10393 [Pseudomonas oryzihabitans]|uniref:Uncharacterized protein n=1 Tax=Pseudomonas oryzihabitans TaxID=47885 RepID=A0A1G5MVM6_9PSED|nr:hypothetical protein SAMN05216279_10393 [Pseudomonas psychrotolerans]
MSAIRFWMDVWHGRNGARIIAWYILACFLAAVVYGAAR